MATRPVTQNLPADLPENWTDSQYVSPGGTEVGLTPQHGYNYLGKQVNAAQKAAQEIDEAFENLAPLDSETKKIPKEYLLIDAALSTTSENPVQNKAVKTAIDEKADATNPQFTGSVKVKSTTSGVSPMTITPTSTGGLIRYGDLVSSYGLNISSTGLYVNQDGDNYKIYAENNKPPVDAALSTTSTNPVQNKVVKTALDAKANKSAPIIQNKLYVQTGTTDGTTPAAPHMSIFPASDGACIRYGEGNIMTPTLKITENGLFFNQDGDDYKVYAENNKPPVDTALSSTSTNPVQNKAVKAALDSLQIRAGTYTGNGGESQTITLSRKPNWVLVLQRGSWTGFYYPTSGSYYYGGLALATSPVEPYDNKYVVKITDTGFTVYNEEPSGGAYKILANEANQTYNYLWG